MTEPKYNCRFISHGNAYCVACCEEYSTCEKDECWVVWNDTDIDKFTDTERRVLGIAGVRHGRDLST